MEDRPQRGDSHSLLYILVSGFSFLFGWSLSHSRASNENAIETVHPQNNSSPETRPGPPHLPVAPQIPSTMSQHYQPDRRKDNTPPWKKRVEIAAILVAGVLLGVNIWALKKVRESTDWLIIQTKNASNQQRPRISVRVPESIHIEVDKPIRPDIQIFNYGNSPGFARARIRFEAGPGVIEKFRDMVRHQSGEFMVPEESLGALKALIDVHVGSQFPIETPDLVLSKQDIAKLSAGTIDVVFYGRIFYTDLDNSALGQPNNLYHTIFCFYVIRDGSSLSACPNTYDHPEERWIYTNWAP
jgi:hypothetical protein